MGDRYGHELVTTALFELQSTASALLASEEIYNKEFFFYSTYVVPNWPEAWGDPPPPPNPPSVGRSVASDKGSHDGHSGHGGGHDGAGVAEAIGLFSALARGDFDL
jgi:hypothetical protein